MYNPPEGTFNLNIDEDLDYFSFDLNDDEYEVSNTYTNPSRYITEEGLKTFFNQNCDTCIKYLHVNSRSLKKNFKEVCNLLTISHPLTALAISETWLTDATHDIYHIPGYCFVSKFRVNKIGGGVGMYVNEGYCFKICENLCRMSSCIESIFIELTISANTKILLGCIYRPPNSDIILFNSEIETILNVANKSKYNYTLIAGDFNLDLLKHETHTHTNDFLNVMLSYYMFPTIHRPTRISNNSATLLDNIFIDTVRNSYEAAIIYNDISDHLPVAVTLETSNITNINQTISSKKTRCFDKQYISKFNNYLLNTNWDNVYNIICNFEDPSRAYDAFLSTVNTHFCNSFPEKKINLSRKNTPRQE